MREHVTRELSRSPGGRARTADVDDALWRQLSEALSPDGDLYRVWLGLQCRMIRGVISGVAVVPAPGADALAPAAVWPEGRRRAEHLAGVIQRALAGRRGVAVLRPVADGADGPLRERGHVACPVHLDGKLALVVALEVGPRPEAELESIVRDLEWGAGWLEALMRRRDMAASAARGERLKAVLDLTASALAHPRFQGAATAFATALATRLDCDRVSVGFLRRGHTRVRALSHTARFGEHATLVRAIGAAMDEVLDQGAAIAHPAPPGSAARVTRAHRELGTQHGGGAICTVPLTDATRVVGALTLERPADRPFDAATVELCEAVAAAAGPVLELRRRDDRWLTTKVAEAARDSVGRLLGPGHLGLKLGVLAALALATFMVYAEGDYRVTAPVVMEAGIRRAAVAPVSGFIKEAPVRAGDAVRRGQVLAILDDREVRLERLRWKSQEEQFARQRDQALAALNAAQVQVARAQIAQAQAQIALLDEQLARTRVVAEFDGVVVSGDLSQSLGSPVTRGDVLFEVAPADAYRVVLQVDERDISEVRRGQRGHVVLAAAPGDPLPITVEKITPVSTAREGRNAFRVDAALEREAGQLRPGLEGVAKIEIDRRRLLSIWTREITEWARLAVWRWLP